MSTKITPRTATTASALFAATFSVALTGHAQIPAGSGTPSEPVTQSGSPRTANGDVSDLVTGPAADLIKRGRAENDARKFQEAVVTFTQALAVDPASVDAHNGRGYAYDQLKDAKKALADFTASIHLSQNLRAAAAAYSYRAEVYVYQNKNNEAIDDATRAIAQDARCESAYNGRGMAYLGKRKYDKALADFDEALRLKGDYAAAYYNRGKVYFDQGHFDKAIEDFTRSLPGTPDTKAAIKARIFNNRGVAYGRLKQDDAALGDFSAAIALSPSEAGWAYLNRADTYYDHKQWEKALTDYRSVAQTQLKNPPDWIKNDQDWLPNRIKELERKLKRKP